MMASYKEAVEEFSKGGTEFLEHVQLLRTARDAYQRARTVSTQIRSTLDAGDETMQVLMAQIEHVLVRSGEDTFDKNKPQRTKVETIKTTEKNADVVDKKAATA